jgi:hypothetical protein
MTTALFVGAAYGSIAWGTWMFLTRPLVHINRSDRLYCLTLSILWPAMMASVLASMLLRPRRPRRAYVEPSKAEA